MNIKKSILELLMRSGKRKFGKAAADYDAATHTLEKDLVRANEVRSVFHIFSNIVSFMSIFPKKVREVAGEKGGVLTVMMVPEQRTDKIILYAHGGGFFFPLEKFEIVFAAHVAEATQTSVCIPHYRLAPEYPFPAGLDDVFSVYKALLKDQYNPKKIVILGDSAGGNLALSLMLKIKQAGLPQPGAAILLSPFLDLNMDSETWRTKADVDPAIPIDKNKSFYFTYLRGESPNNPFASPILGDFKGLPPIMIQVGGREVLLNDSLELAKRAKTAGVDVTLDVNEDMFHVYPLYTFLDEAKVALGKIALFIKMKLG